MRRKMKSWETKYCVTCCFISFLPLCFSDSAFCQCFHLLIVLFSFYNHIGLYFGWLFPSLSHLFAFCDVDYRGFPIILSHFIFLSLIVCALLTRA